MVVAKLIFSCVFAFLITFYLVPLLCAIARKMRFVDAPDGKLKVHKQETPYLGGVAVYCGFLCGIALTAPFDNRLFLFIVGTTLLLFVGLIDDLLALRPYQKFFGQIIAALCFLKSGFYLKEHFFSNLWSIPISFFWILTVVNAFNLVDVMDGLATTLAIFSAVGFFVVALMIYQPVALIVLSSLIGALGAFLWYNKPVARIYLGDAGSLFIGGVIAIVPFFLEWSHFSPYGFLAPIIFTGIPLLEIASLIIIRIYKGLPVYLGSPHHFSSYLRAKGWSVGAILWYISLLSSMLIIVGVAFTSGLLSFAQVIGIGTIFLLFWVINLSCTRQYSYFL